MIALAVHADWSMDPRKRWMTVARPAGEGWVVQAPEPVGALETWLPRLRQTAGDGGIALGVDLPIGLPRAYVQRHVGVSDFMEFLRNLANTPTFFDVCATLDEISPDRPFYPARGVFGMTRAAHAAALDLGSPAGLSRQCDRATTQRPAGAPLFWTLGANQTGKAAITAWRDWLLPALTSPEPPLLWPFEGGLHDLLGHGRVVVAETYPAECMRQRGLRLRGSKRRQSDRAAVVPAIVSELAALGARPAFDPADGFGSDPAGEDRFDSVLGLLGLLAVLTGRQPDFIPKDPWIHRWEGWVLGQTDMPSS